LTGFSKTETPIAGTTRHLIYDQKLALTFAIAALAVASSARAQYLDSYATVNGTFYDLNATTDNPDFHNASLGTFNLGDSLLLGAEMNLSGGNVEFSRLGFNVSNTTGFQEIGGNFQQQVNGNDRWVLDGANRINLLANISEPGNYTVSVYLHGRYNGGNDFFLNRGGVNEQNFTANFTVVPEPSSLSLLAGPAILGSLVLCAPSARLISGSRKLSKAPLWRGFFLLVGRLSCGGIVADQLFTFSRKKFSKFPCVILRRALSFARFRPLAKRLGETTLNLAPG
jgi:hypothetical protein